MKKLAYLLFVLTVCASSAQTINKPKDDPEGRLNYEIQRLKDPATGSVPRAIRLKELDFMGRQMSLLRTTNSGLVWTNRGPYNVGGRTRALAVDVNTENTILAGGVSGGIWKSTDQGASWTKTTSPGDLQSVSAIAQDPRAGNTDIWYYSTGEIRGNSASGFGAPYRGDGIYKSINGGDSWSLLASTSNGFSETAVDFDYNHEIVVNPTNGDVLVANIGGIYRSQNGGSSFSKVLNSSGTWSDIAVTSNGVLYASIASSGIWRSTNGGTNWTQISPVDFPVDGGERKEIGIAPSNEDILYIIGEDGNDPSGHTLWKYNNGTGVWEDRSANIPQFGGSVGDFTSQGGYDLLVKVKSDDENFVVVGGTNLYSSTDGFATSNNSAWIGGYAVSTGCCNLYTNQHPDQHALIFLSGDKALSGNDGGVQLTNDITDLTVNGANESVDWIWKNNGYLTTQAYAVSVGGLNQIMAGFQDNSTWLTTSTNPTATWTDQFGGDGGYSAFSSDARTRYVSFQRGQVFRLSYPSATSQSPTSDVYITPSGYNSSLFIAPLYLDPKDDNLFFLGGDFSLFVNTNPETATTTNGWKSIALNGLGYVSEMAFTPAGDVVVGTSSSEVFVVRNPAGESTVEEITGNNFPGGAFISGVDVNDYNPLEIIVCFSNYSIPSIFRTTDGGQTWTDVSGNLEEFPNGTGGGPSVRTVRILGNGDRYFVGTSTGLYSTDQINGASTTWTLEDADGIGAVVVEHMAKREDGQLVIGTHGNGLFSTDVPINNVLANDLIAVRIDSPSGGVLEDENVEATVFNGGSSAVTAFDISLFVDGALITTESVTGISIPQQESYSHTFSTSVDLSVEGNYTLRVEVDLAGDANASNDVVEKDIETIGAVTEFPYVMDFEAGADGWEASGVWQLGAPNDQNISDAAGGSFAWVTDLDANYPDEHTAVLQTPFFKLSGLTKPIVTFDLNIDIESDWDGLVLGYRTNLTESFTRLGSGIGVENWYNGTAFVFGDDPAWNGNSSGLWFRAKADLTSIKDANAIQLAFIFQSDQSVNFEGAGMDNFSLGEDGVPLDILISNASVQENLPIGTLVGKLSTVDLDGSEHTYTLEEELDFNSFNLSIDSIYTSQIFDYEFQSSYTIRITTEDIDGNTLSGLLNVEIINDESDDPLGLDDFEDKGIGLYPNPVKDRLSLKMVNDYFGEVRVQVFSINGQQMAVDKTLFKNQVSIKGLVDFYQLERGLYLIQIQMGDEIVSGKIIKQ